MRHFFTCGLFLVLIMSELSTISAVEMVERPTRSNNEISLPKILQQIQFIALKKYFNKRQLIHDLLNVQDLILRSDQVNEKNFPCLLYLLDTLVKLKKLKRNKIIFQN